MSNENEQSLQDALSAALATRAETEGSIDTSNLRDAQSDDVDPLEAAFPSAFSVPSPRPPAPEAPVQSGTEPNKLKDPPPVTSSHDSAPAPSSAESSTEDSWKTEYEGHVQTWRAQSAEAREKAEKERAKWERIRAAEQQEVSNRRAKGRADEVILQEHGWETVNNTQSSSASVVDVSVPHSPSAEAAMVEVNIPQRTPLAPQPPNTIGHHKHEASEKWEEVPSLASSFPSLSFPERSDTPSPVSHPSVEPTPQISVTRSIFDPSLPTRLRVSGLLTSLAINLLLPFVNGIMLGFGEIFAKQAAFQWFGWRAPGTVATSVGLNTPSYKRRKQ